MKKEKFGRNVEINISNKFSYSIMALAAVILLGIGVYASGGTHTMGELTAPCTNGIITSSSGAWGCIQTPIACTGTNQVLQWSGSAWSCVTINTGFACNWDGWSPVCSCLTTDDPNYVCGYENGPVYPYPLIQEYCSSGYVIDSQSVYCCRSIGGDCQPY